VTFGIGTKVTRLDKVKECLTGGSLESGGLRESMNESLERSGANAAPMLA